MSFCRFAWFAIVCCAPLFAVSTAGAQATDLATLKSQIEATWHVRIADKNIDAQIVPLIPAADGPVQLTDVSPDNEPACLAQVSAAFAVYPPALVSHLVSTVVLAGDITAQSVRAGGFQTSGLLALNCDQSLAPGAGAFNEDSVHNDLAGLLLTADHVDLAGWATLNPRGFTYGDLNSVKAELRDPQGRFGDDELYRHGFVSRLGLTDVSNDFDTFAGQVFGHPRDTVALMARYPSLRPKVALLIKIYLEAAPGLAGFFDRSGLAKAAD